MIDQQLEAVFHALQAQTRSENRPHGDTTALEECLQVSRVIRRYAGMLLEPSPTQLGIALGVSAAHAPALYEFVSSARMHLDVATDASCLTASGPAELHDAIRNRIAALGRPQSVAESALAMAEISALVVMLVSYHALDPELVEHVCVAKSP